MNSLTDFTQSVEDAFRNAGAYASDMLNPTIRLGVTGLSRAGKTVFITSLVHNLIAGGRLPFFRPLAEGRIKRAYLQPQPNDAIPRFNYEEHLAKLTGETPVWPESTRRISQLRLTVEYHSDSIWKRGLGYDHLNIDIVDYPGEWLLDLPLLNMSYEAWSRQAFELANAPERQALAADWLTIAKGHDPTGLQDELAAGDCAKAFKAYLLECRKEAHAFSTVPPGRFLMPGDLAGSPALTFAPLILPEDGRPPSGSLWAMMARRYEAYKTHVVKPFFRDHFAQLDRQIVLVDTLSALNAGPEAVADLERALTSILQCFHTGAKSWWSSLFSPRIDRVIFAATKADHLHHTSHDRLEAILRRLTEEAVSRASFAGAAIEVVALAAIRATREATATHNGESLPCIQGVPFAGERLGHEVFDGAREIAVFPGDLPEKPEDALACRQSNPTEGDEMVRFIRFRPPAARFTATGGLTALPHIRLDRVLDFLIGDRLS